MDVRSSDLGERPLPAADDFGAPFWAAAAEGRLLIQHCAACGHRQHYPRPLCTACGATPEWERASGRGTVHTFTIIRQNGAPPFRDELPYVVAVVELEEGPRMLSNVTGCAPEDVHVGMEVVAYAVRVDGDIALPFWEPSPER